ncbi:MAG: hypothetical protein WC071_03710 [Victivallaceae bacterium]
MFSSKLFTVVVALTVLALLGAIGLQVMEMQQYNLFNSVYQRYFAGNSASSAAVQPTAGKTESKENADASKDEKK